MSLRYTSLDVQSFKTDGILTEFVHIALRKITGLTPIVVAVINCYLGFIFTKVAGLYEYCEFSSPRY